MYKLLIGLGVSKLRIAYEFFGKAASLEALAFANTQAPKTLPVAASKAPAALANLVHITNPDAWALDKSASLANAISNSLEIAQADFVSSDTDCVVYFSRSKLTVTWSHAHTSLLQLAEQHGLTPDFSCRSGICNSCKSTLLEGTVEYFEPPLEPPGSHELLLCCSRPIGSVVIDL